MIAIKPKFEIISEPNWDETIITLEKAIRTCYKSEKNINAESADKLIRNIIKRGHESTLEHAHMSVRFTCDRGVSHELVRHRHCSFSQESTRYVNYVQNGETDKDMQFILPCWIHESFLGHYDEKSIIEQVQHAWSDIKVDSSAETDWINACVTSQQYYNSLIDRGWNPEHARTVLNNSLKTELVVTTNIRDWRHLLGLRCDKTAHPQVRELMVPLLNSLIEKCPTLFDSVEYEYEDWTHIKQRATKTGSKPKGE